MESTVLRSVTAGALVCLFAALAAPAPAHAQSARARVRQLNQEGMAAFHELDLERGEALLAEALALAEREHVDGTDLARIHLSLGVIAVAGYSDSARGVESFMRALQIDPGISPDPMTSTPEIQSVFQLARTRLASGGRPPTGPAATRTTTNPTAAGASIVHEPPTEQTLQTPLPIYVELRDADRVVRTVVMYRAHGMRRYRELALAPMGQGFGVEIPCDDVFEGDFVYYVIAFDASDRSVASVASATAPLHVRIVSTPTAATATLALPGRPAPRSCAVDECPPGMDCGSTSTSASTGADASGGDDESPAGAESRPRFFLQVGGVLGAYRATSGMQTDSIPENPAAPRNESYVASGDPGCDSDPNTYCVRVTQSGVLPVFGARLMVGYWVAPRWAIAVGGRVGPGGGTSALSFAMLQFRIQALLSKVEDTRFHAALTFGTSLGQVQVQPEQAGAPGVDVVRPWAQVGLGSVQLGTILGYRFADHFGLFAQLDGSVFYRRFNVGADFTLGLELDF